MFRKIQNNGSWQPGGTYTFEVHQYMDNHCNQWLFGIECFYCSIQHWIWHIFNGILGLCDNNDEDSTGSVKSASYLEITEGGTTYEPCGPSFPSLLDAWYKYSITIPEDLPLGTYYFKRFEWYSIFYTNTGQNIENGYTGWEFLKITISSLASPSILPSSLASFPSRPYGFGGADSGSWTSTPGVGNYTYTGGALTYTPGVGDWTWTPGAVNFTYTGYCYADPTWPAFQLSLNPADLDVTSHTWGPISTFNIEQLGGGKYVKNIIVVNNKGAIYVGATE